MNTGNKPKRITSIDARRGLTVLGMVLCASIGFDSGLPGWMFHAQTPPPTYAFDPTNAGLTWVDLVFPFFLFALGAAFPLAMKKKIDGGTPISQIAVTQVKRWITLILFAVVLGNSYDIQSPEHPLIAPLMKIGIWLGLFAALVRLNPKSEFGKGAAAALPLAGVAIIAALAAVKVKFLGISLSVHKNDIIMMILANVALFGALIWIITRNNLYLRWLAFAIIFILKALDSYLPQGMDFVPGIPGCGWFFNWEWLQYLLIAIPASVVGDLLLREASQGENPEADNKDAAAGFIAITATIVQLWGLYTRQVAWDLGLTIALGIAFVALTFKKKDAATLTGLIGFGLLIAGIIFDPIDGGITKDYCNISYLLVTGGMSALTTYFLIILDRKFSIGCKVLVMTGQNPMIAYTVTSFLIIPLLSIVGLMGPLSSMTSGSIFWGMAQGIILTGLMTLVTCLFTKFKLFWRS